MDDIRAIDCLNFPHYVDPDLAVKILQYDEFKIVFETSFKAMGVVSPEALRARSLKSVDQMVAEMDEAGYDYVVMSDYKQWSYRRHFTLIMDYPVDLVNKLREQGKGRVIGSASYNPFRIEESLRDIDRAVKQYGFKCVYFHPITFGLAPNDRQSYPLYGKCVELGIPVGFQVGHSAEILPSEVGRPMYADQVAIDFPNLKIILSHTGWPWLDEWMSMLIRHPNVYGDTAGYYPRAFDPRLVEFMNGRGQDKILFGTNGFGLKDLKKQFMELPLKDKVKQKILRENARKVLNLT
ncbi:MAG: amidohydrolase [Chloroflexi bacterium]|nr:amidohydrolase [Chloroflexota bacterium]